MGYTHMHIHSYTLMRMHSYIHSYTLMHIHSYIPMHIHPLYINTCLHSYTFIHMLSYTFISFAFILPGVYIHINTLIFTPHIHSYISYTPNTLIYTRIHTYTLLYTLIHPCTHIIHFVYHSFIHSFIHTFIIHLCTTVYLVGQLVDYLAS